jgi:Tol biopolymer transport system component
MALTPGTRFGTYEITGPLGAGGMGEVYRARDTTLGRDVAIKVLPASFAADADRVTRFEREAKTLAALNHPNIAHIYGLERSEDTTALVMELVEGPTLADRIAQRPLPLDEALHVAMQIADALEAAHGKQIVHRDLKPANVKLTPDGLVKLLDFGIAKMPDPAGQTSGGRTPTLLTPALTETGILLGTAAYMAPEQAKGRPIDQRADIWAFGCVLYEMLTGQPVFLGEDVTTTLARVLEREPNLDALPAAVPPAVRQTIRLCLAKDPRKRIRHIGDVRLALEGAFAPADAGVTAGLTDAAGATSRRRVTRFASAAFVIGAAASAIAVYVLTAHAPPAPRVTRLTIDVPAGETLALDGQSRSFAITRDGATVAFATGLVSGRYQWYLRALDALEPQPLAGAKGPFETPFFSPDGRSIGFDDGELWRMSVLGGTPTRLADPPQRLRGASWGENGDILYAVERGGLWHVPAGGGEPEQLLAPENETRQQRWPQWLPGQRAALFTAVDGATNRIALLDVATRKTRTLIPDGTAPTYSPTGHIVYGVAGGSLRAVRFDLAALEVVGEPVEVVGNVAPIASTGGIHYALSPDGTLVYGQGQSGDVRGVTPVKPAWLTDSGGFEDIGMEPCICRGATISPDGTRMALVLITDSLLVDQHIWIWSFAQKTLTRLTFDGQPTAPVWSPDSSRVAYNDSKRGIVVQRADGTGAPTVIVPDTSYAPRVWTPDDRLIIEPDNGPLAVVAATPGATPATLFESAFDAFNPALSPDGRWLAYQSRESGASQVYVRPFPDVDGGKWQISTNTGTSRAARWAPDGTKLYFVTSDVSDTNAGRELMAVPIEPGPTFAWGQPSRVVDTYSQTSTEFVPAVDPVSGRILVGVPQLPANADRKDMPSRLVVVQHFDEELKRRLPAE